MRHGRHRDSRSQ